MALVLASSPAAQSLEGIIIKLDHASVANRLISIDAGADSDFVVSELRNVTAALTGVLAAAVSDVVFYIDPSMAPVAEGDEPPMLSLHGLARRVVDALSGDAAKLRRLAPPGEVLSGEASYPRVSIKVVVRKPAAGSGGGGGGLIAGSSVTASRSLLRSPPTPYSRALAGPGGSMQAGGSGMIGSGVDDIGEGGSDWEEEARAQRSKKRQSIADEPVPASFMVYMKDGALEWMLRKEKKNSKGEREGGHTRRGQIGGRRKGWT